MTLPPPWHGLHYLPERVETLLDVGCNAGENLEHAHQLGVPRLYGIEINADAVAQARARLANVDGAQVTQGSADELPYADASMDAAICFEVLEHIPAELRPGAIREVYRVLKPGAPFVITVPAAGLFAGLDPANMRFRLPAAYSFVSRAIGGRGREVGFEDQKHGVVWHHHFRRSELEKLLAPHFRVERVRYRGSLVAPVANWLQFPFYRLRAYDHPVLKAINRAVDWELRVPMPERLAYNMILVARRD